MEMIVIKAASVVEVHLLGLSPNHSCLKLKENRLWNYWF